MSSSSKPSRCFRQLSPRLLLPPRSLRQFVQYTTSSKLMVGPPEPAGRVISETAKEEGGPHKGSESAQMQSQIGRTRNFEQAAEDVGAKMQDNPGSVTSEDAAHLKSREARATGQAQPPKDSISSAAQRLAAANEGSTHSPGPSDSAEQSAQDRLKNFDSAAENIAAKMARDPDAVTKEDAKVVHSREQRAFGTTSKGGVASQAHSLVNEKEKQGS